MQKKTGFKYRRLQKKGNVNKEGKETNLNKEKKTIYNKSRAAIRQYVNNEYGIKVLKSDIGRSTYDLNSSKIKFNDFVKNLNDDEFNEEVNSYENQLSGNTNGFVLGIVTNEVINNPKLIPIDNTWKRDHTRWNSNKLKSKQRKFDRDMKSSNNYL